jgi:3-deoxy-D-manno-octulosonic-acid transferase
VLKFYRSLASSILKPLIESRIFPNFSQRTLIFENPPTEKSSKRIWFHASSVGELEMLIPVIEKRKEEVILTVFSESAEKPLQNLAARLHKNKATGPGPKVLFAGYCPWEGEWKTAFGLYQPDLFVSARYEAWPELWASLGELKIPLTIVGSQLRTSLLVAKNIVNFMSAELPPLEFLSIEESEVASLQKEFPSAKVSAAGDPRWDRVAERAKLGNPRARQLIEQFSQRERPWGVLGSAWVEDLSMLGKSVFELPGTLWVVPHEVDAEHIREFEDWLKSHEISFVKTSSYANDAAGSISNELGNKNDTSAMPRCLLVDEMGFLLELYSAADWAYVGGGFGKGVHNTIEPAIHGIPIFCGSARIHRFPEVKYLQDVGQLIVLMSMEDVPKLRDVVTRGHYQSTKSVWKESAHRQLGASERISKILDESLTAHR